MSLLNDASLVMIPSGYKDGTLYSAKPTNGDGDFTFSRGSNLAATRVNSEGLIEKGRENLLLQSNTFDTTWSTSSSTVTGGQSGYDGSSDAWLFTTTVAGAAVQQAFTSTGVLTYSVYAKAGSVNGIRLRIDATSDANGYYDLVNGTIYSSEGIDASISNVGNGWYKCSLSQNVSGAVKIQFFTTDGTTSYDNGNIYIQDAQLEQGLVATDYIETTTTTAQAGILEDMPRLDYSGGASCPSLLLEPQRSNLLTQSEYFGASYWSKGNVDVELADILSPDGFKNAYKITETSASGQHAINISSSYRPNLNAGSHTHSCFVKVNGVEDIVFYNNGSSGGAGVNIDLSDGTYSNLTGGATAASVEPYSNNWYRITLTFTAIVGNTSPSIYLRTTGSYTGDGISGIYMYGMQTEAGSYSTSLIPTYGSSVTRSADGYDNTTGISGLLGSTTGTFFVDMERFNIENRDASGGSLELRSSDGQTELNIDIEAAGSTRSFYRDGGSFNFIYQSTQLRCKFCFVYNGANLKLYHNGVKQFDSNVLSLQNFSELTYTGVDGAKKHHQILLFPTPLTDQEAIDLTTI